VGRIRSFDGQPMKRAAARLGMVTLVAMWVAAPIGAQELERGTWTGSIALPGGSSLPVTYVIGDTDGALSVVMTNAQLGDVVFSDARFDGEELTFWWEPGIRVDCSLLRKEDGSFVGVCSDGAGTTGEGTLTMMPPSG
jgi:hypothetical protein